MFAYYVLSTDEWSYQSGMCGGSTTFDTLNKSTYFRSTCSSVNARSHVAANSAVDCSAAVAGPSRLTAGLNKPLNRTTDLALCEFVQRDTRWSLGPTMELFSERGVTGLQDNFPVQQ